jgi:Family of unknown function (DUF5317)
MLLPLLMAAIPATILGWILGGRLAGLAGLRFRAYWWIVGGLAAQAVAIGSFGVPAPLPVQARPAFILGSYVLILYGLWRNWRIPGMLLVCLGFASNFIAIAANGGNMPVTYEALVTTNQTYLVNGSDPGQLVAQSKDILLTQGQTRLLPLTDVLITPWPRKAASVGDFIALAGIGTMWVLAMRRRSTPESAPPVTAVLAA